MRMAAGAFTEPTSRCSDLARAVTESPRLPAPSQAPGLAGAQPPASLPPPTCNARTLYGCGRPSRTIDLPRFVDEALDQLLDAHPRFSGYNFETLNLCRSSDDQILYECLERRWPDCGLRGHTTQAFNSATTKLWLPMELPHWAMSNPSPYVYLVDRLSQLAENRMWFEARHRIVEEEIVLDARAGALTSHELLAL
jgi:hypothetical protein